MATVPDSEHSQLQVVHDLDGGRTRAAAEQATRFGLSWFLPLLQHHRKLIVQVLLTTLFLQGCGLAVPLFFQIVIDKVLTYYSQATLIVAMLALIVVSLFKVIFSYVRAAILADLSGRVDVELGSYGLRRVLQLPFGYFSSTPAGQIIARIREVEAIRKFLTGEGVAAVYDMLVAVMMLIVLLFYSTELTLITLLSTGLHIALSFIDRPMFRRASNARMEATAASGQILVEALSGIATIKAAAVESSITDSWDESLLASALAAVRESRLVARGKACHEYLGNLTSGALLFFGARLVIQGELTVGELMAFYMMTSLLGSPLGRLANLGQEIQQVKVSLTRFGELVDEPPEKQPGRPAPLSAITGEIQFQQVAFRYGPHSREVLRDLSLHIPAGQVLGIVGPSGSGKSTLARLLQRFHTPVQGRILIDGTDIGLLPTPWLRRQIGIVPQETFLFNTTIHANIALGAVHLTRPQVEAAAQLAGAHEFIERLPDGYDTRVEERGANLSGGERQRIAIARALIGNPRVLIFDEATSAVDHATECLIQQRMAQIVRGRTVLIIAHRLAALRPCNRIIVMEHGQIREAGTHEELLGINGGLYHRLWSLRN